MVQAKRLRMVPVVLGGVVALGAVGIGAAGASPSHADPGGNNGTIKVDRMPFDTDPNNEPHVGCSFQVDFYGFDKGDDLFADVKFEAWPPTPATPKTLLTDKVFIGEDSSAGGGSQAGLDAEKTYDLSAELAKITPHPQQGWHVKLTIHADGSKGADTKHKVFWVKGCEAPGGGTTTTTMPGGGGTTTSTTMPGGGTTTTMPGGETTTTMAGGEHNGGGEVPAPPAASPVTGEVPPLIG
jgi:hypothetical protein